MNKEQYNNIIKASLNEDILRCENNLETVRAVFNNMGVALPQGDFSKVSETLATNDYMYWKSCTQKEAQEYANHGIPTIRIDKTNIQLISAEETDETIGVLATASSILLDNNDLVTEELDPLSTKVTYYAYSCGSTSTTGSSQMIANDTYYMNSAGTGRYLQKDSNNVKGISDLLANLGNSIKWRIEKLGSYYVIRYAADPTKYLGVEAENPNSAIVTIYTINSYTIPNYCKWIPAYGKSGFGGVLFKNLFNSRYLTCDTTIQTRASLGQTASAAYIQSSWRIIQTSKLNNSDAGYREMSPNTKFENVGVSLESTNSLRIKKQYDNEIWVKPQDFSYTMGTPNIAVIDSKTGVVSAHDELCSINCPIAITKVTATHKVTGRTLEFYIIIGFDYNVTSTPLRENIIDGLNQPHDVWPASEESIFYKFPDDKRIQSLNISYAAAMATVVGGDLIGYDLSKELLSHFLDNSGSKYTINLTDYTKNWSLAKNYKQSHVNALIKIIELIATSNYQTLKTPIALGCAVSESSDFGYSIGSYSISIDCSFKQTGSNTYRANIKYELHDIYDWNKTITDMGKLPVSPAEMWELHHGGLAKNFEVYGKETFTITWSKGQTIGNGVVVT